MKTVKDILNRYDLGMRIVFFTITMFLCLTFLLMHIKLAMASSLKTVSVVEDGVIRLGDLFEGIPDKADIVLGRSPQPGKEMVIGAPALSRVALSYGIHWQPQGYQDQVIVRRSASVIDKAMIDNLLKEHLEEEGISENIEITYLSGIPQIILPADYPGTAEVTDFMYNHSYDRFQATVVAPSKDRPMRQITVHASVDRLVSVPVINARMTEGEIISSRNIDYVDMKLNGLSKDVIIDETKLIGKTPRRMVLPYKPIKSNEIQQPTLVERGASITILYQTGTLQLTAKGRALQDGAAGDIIRVMNIDSNRYVDGVVLENGLVEVGNV